MLLLSLCSKFASSVPSDDAIVNDCVVFFYTKCYDNYQCKFGMFCNYRRSQYQGANCFPFRLFNLLNDHDVQSSPHIN